MMAIIADLTELKRTESALKLSQERLQLAVFGSSLGLWDWNIATGATYFDSQWKAMISNPVTSSCIHLSYLPLCSLRSRSG
ncbi:hypothetical protein [Microcoleus anatoxicus]